MGIENIVAGGGIGIAVTGMIVVVVGLVLISLFIALLPKLFVWGGQVRELRSPRVEGADAGVMGQEISPGIDPDLLAAIGCVLEAERERDQDRQRITMRADDQQGVWTAMGKMRTLSKRL